MLFSNFMAAGATLYLHIYQPQAKNIFYAKLFTYPALELQFEFPQEVSEATAVQVANALEKEYPNSKYISAAQRFRFKNDLSGGIYTPAKAIPNYWKIKGNHLYFYMGASKKEKLDFLLKYLKLRFSDTDIKLNQKITLTRHDKTFPVKFYFQLLNKQVLPNEKEVLNHSLDLQSMDIRMTRTEKPICSIKFRFSDDEWLKNFQKFYPLLKKDASLKSAFSIKDSMSNDDIKRVAAKFLFRLKHQVHFSNGVALPAKVLIDQHDKGNLVVVLKEYDSYRSEEACFNLITKTFPSLMPNYMKHHLLRDLPKTIKIKEVNAKSVRFSPFYYSVTPVYN